MKETIDFKQEYLQSIQESLEYASFTDSQINDAITELEGINWFDSTDQNERVLA